MHAIPAPPPAGARLAYAVHTHAGHVVLASVDAGGFGASAGEDGGVCGADIAIATADTGPWNVDTDFVSMSSRR